MTALLVIEQTCALFVFALWWCCRWPQLSPLIERMDSDQTMAAVIFFQLCSANETRACACESIYSLLH